MASTENPDPETGKSEPLPASTEPLTPPQAPSSASGFLDCRKIDIIIRVLLFSATLTALIVMVTSDQTEMTQLPRAPSPAPVSAEFSDSPAFMSVFKLNSILHHHYKDFLLYICFFHLNTLRYYLLQTCRYFVVALVVAGFYALISTIISISLLLRPEFAAQFSIYISSFDMVT